MFLTHESIDENSKNAGFIGGTFFGNKFNPNKTGKKLNKYEQGHVTMTYTALAILKILGDDYSRVNKKAIIHGLKHLQQEDGSFYATIDGSNADFRFMYSACAASAFLNDFSGINADLALKRVLACQRYDGAFAQEPGMEAHGINIII